MGKQQELEQQKFINAYSGFITTSVQLIQDLYKNLDKNLPEDTKQHLDKLFSDYADKMELVEKLGTEIENKVIRRNIFAN